MCSCSARKYSIAVKRKSFITEYEKAKRKPKCDATDTRIGVCRVCETNFWVGRNLFCSMFVHRAGRTLWPDAVAFVPLIARLKEEKCPLGKW